MAVAKGQRQVSLQQPGVQRLLLTAACAVLPLVILLAPNTQGVDVNVAVIVPFNDKYLFSYHRLSPAIKEAMKEVKRRQLLRSHHLRIRFADSRCNTGYAMANAIDFFMKHKVDVFFGPVCDLAIAPVARQVKFWNIPTVSAGAMAYSFTKARSSFYPLLTRVGPIHFGHLCQFFAVQSRHYGWKKLKLLYQSSGQDHVMKLFAHLAAESLHFMLKRVPYLEHDPHKMSDDLAQEEVKDVLLSEVGLEYGGRLGEFLCVVVCVWGYSSPA